MCLRPFSAIPILGREVWKFQSGILPAILVGSGESSTVLSPFPDCLSEIIPTFAHEVQAADIVQLLPTLHDRLLICSTVLMKYNSGA
jgi:hypothetical protein